MLVVTGSRLINYDKEINKFRRRCSDPSAVRRSEPSHPWVDNIFKFTKNEQVIQLLPHLQRTSFDPLLCGLCVQLIAYDCVLHAESNLGKFFVKRSVYLFSCSIVFSSRPSFARLTKNSDFSERLCKSIVPYHLVQGSMLACNLVGLSICKWA